LTTPPPPPPPPGFTILPNSCGLLSQHDN